MRVAENLLFIARRGLISIKAQTVDYEIPMNPITMMRNALGKANGLELEAWALGCGVPTVGVLGPGIFGFSMMMRKVIGR